MILFLCYMHTNNTLRQKRHKESKLQRYEKNLNFAQKSFKRLTRIRCKSTHFLSDLEPQLDAIFLNSRLYTNIFKYLQIGDARTCCFVSSLYRPSPWRRFFSH